MKLLYFVLRFMSSIIFWTLIPHRKCTYLELCPTRESSYIKQSTTSKNNFVNWKFCAKRTNQFQQASSKSEEVPRENRLWTYFWSLIVLRRKLYLELCKTTNTLRIKHSTTSNKRKYWFEVVIQKYEQIHTRGLHGLHPLCSQIPHGLWTSHTKSSYHYNVQCECLTPINWVFMSQLRLTKSHMKSIWNFEIGILKCRTYFWHFKELIWHNCVGPTICLQCFS